MVQKHHLVQKRVVKWLIGAVRYEHTMPALNNFHQLWLSQGQIKKIIIIFCCSSKIGHYLDCLMPAEAQY